MVQVYSAVHREDPGSLPVGKPGVHHGGGGGWVYQSTSQPCWRFNRGGWHGCEEVYINNFFLLLNFHCQVQTRSGQALAEPGGGGNRWGWWGDYQVQYISSLTFFFNIFWFRLSDGRRDEVVLTMDEDDIIMWSPYVDMWSHKLVICDHFWTLQEAKPNLKTVINVMKLLCCLVGRLLSSTC